MVPHIGDGPKRAVVFVHEELLAIKHSFLHEKKTVNYLMDDVAGPGRGGRKEHGSLRGGSPTGKHGDSHGFCVDRWI